MSTLITLLLVYLYLMPSPQAVCQFPWDAFYGSECNNIDHVSVVNSKATALCTYVTHVCRCAGYHVRVGYNTTIISCFKILVRILVSCISSQAFTALAQQIARTSHASGVSGICYILLSCITRLPN